MWRCGGSEILWLFAGFAGRFDGRGVLVLGGGGVVGFGFVGCIFSLLVIYFCFPGIAEQSRRWVGLTVVVVIQQFL